MKKLSMLLTMSMFAAALMLTACGGDDDAPQTPPAETNPLVGYWESDDNGMYGGEVSTKYLIRLSADNTVAFDYRMYAHGTTLHNAYQKKGTYTVADNVITVVFTQHIWIDVNDGSFGEPETSGGETYRYTYRLVNDKLLLTGTDDTNGGSFTDLSFTRK